MFGPLVVKVGGFTITPILVAAPFIGAHYLFSLWKKFKDEHSDEAVIRFSLYTLFSFLFTLGIVLFIGGGEYALLLALLALILGAIDIIDIKISDNLLNPLAIGFSMYLISIILF